MRTQLITDYCSLITDDMNAPSQLSFLLRLPTGNIPTSRFVLQLRQVTTAYQPVARLLFRADPAPQ